MSSKNILLPILVLIIVLVIWFNQNLFRNHRTDLLLEIRFINLPEDHIVTQITPEDVYLTVEGRGIEILRFNRSVYYLEIDVSNLQLGSNELTVTDQKIILEEPYHRGILKFYLNRRVTIEIDRSVITQIPVTLRYMTQEDEDFFRPRNAQPQPNIVEIVGPGNIVARISSITTVPLSANDLKEGEQLKAELEIPEGVMGIKPDIVSVKLESPSIIIRTIPLINIQYPRERLSMIIPQSVTIIIEGDVERVQSLRPQSIIAQITMPRDENENYAPINFRLPEGIRLIDYTPQSVQIFRYE